MRIVLDTNILLVSIPRLSKYRPIFDRLLDKTFSLILSNEILTEYEEVISQKANPIVAANIVKMLVSLRNVEKTEIFYRWELIEADSDDNKFVDCAIAGNADFLVTNDKHFGVLKRVDFPEVTVIDIETFLEIIQKMSTGV